MGTPSALTVPHGRLTAQRELQGALTMKHSAIRRPALLMSAAGLVLLGACSDSTTTGSDPTAATSTADVVTAELPLQAYLGDLVSLEESDVVAQQTAVEESVARCMSGEGFEYTVPDVAAMYSDAVHGSDEESDSREWVSTNGYGITERAATAPADGLGPDANLAYTETLSDAARAAYSEALHGKLAGPSSLTEEELVSLPPEERGCRGLAEQEVFATDMWDQPEFASLKDAYRSMLETTEGSVEIAEADAAWAGCMAGTGYPDLSAPADAVASVEAAQEDAWATVDVSADPAARPAPDVQAELNDLEVATALADLTCKEETGYDETVREVRVAAEEQFVIDYTPELDALIAASEQ